MSQAVIQAMTWPDALAAAAAVSFAAWLYLLALHGRFWRCDQRLPEIGELPAPARWPRVAVVIPARNEADGIGETVRSLSENGYPGELAIVVVDDGSTDGTAEAANRAGGGVARVISGSPLPDGWSGKLWAVHQGVAAAGADADFILLGDADIVHAPGTIARLVTKAEADGLAMVSVMALLEARSFWETLLIPPFVFFFQKLYPFPRVNDRKNAFAAAAGGCMMIRRDALVAAGGVEPIRGRIIDDCALARRIRGHGPVWLGLSRDILSTRRYRALSDTWTMVARTAFEQLNHSGAMLLGTLFGMTLLYLVPPVAAITGATLRDPALAALGGGAWLAMSVAFVPTLRHFRLCPLRAPALPVAGLLYALMTVSSALRHWRGGGVVWKGRRYAGSGSGGTADQVTPDRVTPDHVTPDHVTRGPD